MIFNEDSRVKIHCILHLVRLGYQYLSLKNAIWDEDFNISPDIFRASLASIIPDIETDDIGRLLKEVKLVGQKLPLKLKEIWAIRIRLQLSKQVRELAMFNLAIDSKLRGCDLVELHVRDISQGSQQSRLLFTRQ